MTPMQEACRELLAAEDHLAAVQKCFDELPADKTYDLGVRIEWAWGRAMPGYEAMCREIQNRVTERLRSDMEAVVAHAKIRVEKAHKWVGSVVKESVNT